MKSTKSELFSDIESDIELDQPQMVKYVPYMKFVGKHKISPISKLREMICLTNCGYEAIYGNCIPYYDWETYYKTKHEQQENYIRDLKLSYSGVKDTYPNATIYSFESGGYDKNKKDTPWKNSFQFRVRGAGYYACGSQVPQIDGFDQSVYKNENKRQLMRLPYCSKAEQSRYLNRIFIDSNDCDDYYICESLDDCNDDLNETLDMYIIQNIADEKLVTVSDAVDEVARNPEIHTDFEFLNDSSQKNLNYSVDDIFGLVKCLNYKTQCQNWDFWSKVCWCLRNIGDDLNLDLCPIAHEMSKHCDKYDKDETDDMFNAKEKNPTTDPLRLGSLIKWARETNPSKFKLWSETMNMRNELYVMTHTDIENKTPEYICLKSPMEDDDIVDRIR
jgi:hypothetical protein